MVLVGGRVEQLWGTLGVMLALLGENCAEGQRSCLLGCQSTNEADFRFLGVYIAHWYDHCWDLGFPQGFPTKLVTNLVLVGRGRRAMGIHGLLLALLGENCAEGQGSCLLGCQSTNEADLRFLGVYIASCNDHFSALGFPWVFPQNWSIIWCWVGG